MATYVQLRAEKWWGRETVTDEHDAFCDELAERLDMPRAAVGTKGDNQHLNGAHRSQEWILNSRYCTNRTYTTQSGLTPEQLRHIAGTDYTPGVWGTAENRRLTALYTRRLVAAARAGRLPGVVEIQGTLDGKTTFGLHVPSGRVSQPSRSHLDHGHVTHDRRAMRDGRMFTAMLGAMFDEEGDDVFCAHGDKGPKVQAMQLLGLEAGGSLPEFGPDGDFGDETAAMLLAVLGEEVAGDGRTYGPLQYAKMMKKIVGVPGQQGPRGLPGPTPSKVHITSGEAVVVEVRG